MERGTKRVLVGDRIKNGAHPTRRADAAAGSASRDSVDCHPKRANRQLQPDRQSAANMNHPAARLRIDRIYTNDGDMEKWICDFELIASCNGIKSSAHLVTALGALLSGRARAAYDLILESNQAMNYEN
ncbi:unnamed protein product [Echinostoma caproni]|uniref:Transposase n=1 Tax=Echinostoma caproni TaxID=27848 RepID=A0A183B7W2_9TREM|nr:unnamed protein product [Echinostoma caproni]